MDEGVGDAAFMDMAVTFPSALVALVRQDVSSDQKSGIFGLARGRRPGDDEPTLLVKFALGRAEFQRGRELGSGPAMNTAVRVHLAAMREARDQK